MSGIGIVRSFYIIFHIGEIFYQSYVVYFIYFGAPYWIEKYKTN